MNQLLSKYINKKKYSKFKIETETQKIILFLFSTIIIEKKEKTDPWYITYWPVLVGIGCVVIGVGIWIYYSYPDKGGDTSFGNEIMNTNQDINEIQNANEMLIGAINESQTIGNIIDNIKEQSEINQAQAIIATQSEINLSGEIFEILSKNVAEIFPKWNRTEEEILREFTISKELMLEFIDYLATSKPEKLKEFQEMTNFDSELVLEVSEYISYFLYVCY